MIRIGISAIALGLAVMISSFAILNGFKSTIRDKITGFQGHIQIINFSLNTSVDNSPMLLDPSLDSLIKTAPDFHAAWPFINKIAMLRAKDEIEPIVCKGVDAQYNFDFLKGKLIAGRLPNLSDSTSNEVLVSAITAQKLSLKSGASLLVYFSDKNLKLRKFTISGIFQTGVEELDKAFLICNIGVLQKVNGWEGNQVGGYEVQLNNFEALVPNANYIFQNLDMLKSARTIDEIYPQIFDWLNLLDVNTQVILILMLIVAGINMISALLILILEKTNMVGILKALGLKNRNLRNIFLLNATYLIFWGLLIGNFLGIGFCQLQYHFHFLSLDPTSYYVSYVPIQLDFMPTLLLNLGTLLICILILLIPSGLVNKIQPLKAIRFK